MTKKELEKEIEELREELGEFRYKAEKYNQAAEKVEELEKTLSRHEGVESGAISMLEKQIRDLVLRNDILTMTPEQIETMQKIKVRGRTDEPLDLTNRRRL